MRTLRRTLASAVILLLGAILTNIFANDVWERIRSQPTYSTVAVFLALAGLTLLLTAIDRPKRWLVIVATALCGMSVLILCYRVIFAKAQEGAVGVWLHDEYVGVLVPHAAVGTLVSEEPYDLTLELENLTSIPLQITKVEVEKYNKEAAIAMGKQGDLVHSSEYNVMTSIDPDAKITISVPGNQLLPKRAVVKIYHTLSGQPSVFDIDLGARQVPMPRARQLPLEAVYTGTDALEPIRKAANLAASWGAPATIVAAFPGNNKTYIEAVSRLKYIVVDDWVVTFYSLRRKQIYMTFIIGDNVKGAGHLPSPDESDLPEEVVAFPTIGNQRALAIANENNWLCASRRGDAMLESIKVNGAWRTAWFLPYLGPDSLPIVIDAISGKVVKLHGPDGFVE